MTTAAPTEPPEVLTVDETAALLRLDRKTVYAMITEKKLPGVQHFGRTIRVHRTTVIDWLAQGQNSGPRSRR